MELELDVLAIERKDATQGAILRSWLKQHVLPRVLRTHLTIAASAMALMLSMIVVTRNVADFEPTGVTIVNPWKPSP